MPQYSLAEDPSIILDIPGKNDTKKSREAAIEKLLEMMDAGEVDIDLKDGFGPDELILIKAPIKQGASYPQEKTEETDTIAQAVQVLTQFATLRQKVEELRPAAQEARAQIDLLFEGNVSVEQIQQIKEGLKSLKGFAQNNIQLREALPEAEEARKTLDEAMATAAIEKAAIEKAAIKKATEANR
ncbi:hypothetical protein [Aerosakkonema funiforme]|uniref:hypothetical protein n=1 Tax=Aerosakkonema funiforme TaxID=1246630 RepID=UPI0035B72B44